MYLSVIAFALHLVVAVFCVLKLRLGLRQVDWSDEQRRRGTMNKAWLPFYRPPASLLPSRVRMYFRAFVFAPFQLYLIVILHVIVLVNISIMSDLATALRIPVSLLLEWVMGFKVTQSGQREECACIVGNHVSAFDIYALLLITSHSPAVAGQTPKCTAFLAKSETIKMPIIGRVAARLGSVFVDRQNQDKRFAVISSVETKLKNWNSHEAQLAIFPEGTTTNQTFLLPFKSSTLQFPGVKYQPLRIQYSQPHNSLTFSTTLTHLIFALCLDASELKMTWLPVVTGGPGSAEKLRLAISNDGNFSFTDDASFRAHREMTIFAERNLK